MMAAMRPFNYDYNAQNVDPANGVPLKVTGILYTNDFTTYGCLKSGVYYTEALTDYVLEANRDSELVEYLETVADNKIVSMSYNGINMGVYYEYTFTTYDDYLNNAPTKGTTPAVAFVGSSLGMNDILGSLGNMGGGGSGRPSGMPSGMGGGMPGGMPGGMNRGG